MIRRLLWLLGCVTALVVTLWAGLTLHGAFDDAMVRKGCAPLPQDVTPVLAPGPEVARIRFVALGDQGSGDDAARAVAEGVRKVCSGEGCDFLLLLGDSFYPDGLDAIGDPLIERAYESVLGPLGLPAFAVLGNHDVHKHPLPLVLHSLRSKTWRMPNYNYAFQAGPARFQAINSNCALLSWWSVADWLDEEFDWLEEASDGLEEEVNDRTEADKAPVWNLVLSHHSIYSNGEHGDTQRINQWTWRDVSAGRVDFLLSGHNHNLEHLRSEDYASGEDPTEYIVSGAGSVPGEGRAIFKKPGGGDGEKGQSAASSPFRLEGGGGFVWMELTRQRARVRYHGADGRLLYEFEKFPRAQ